MAEEGVRAPQAVTHTLIPYRCMGQTEVVKLIELWAKSIFRRPFTQVEHADFAKVPA